MDRKQSQYQLPSGTGEENFAKEVGISVNKRQIQPLGKVSQ
ncbi:MAG: hypothetical protein WD045_04655 [Pirellulaceae bacterium]